MNEAVREAPKSDLLLEKLRVISRLPLLDRELLANRLGEAMTRIAVSPAEGSRALFDRAWGQDNVQWSKRKRFVRFGDEPAPDPGDAGSLASSGQAWAHLISTAADMLSEAEAGQSSLIRSNHVRKFLYGTSVLPSSDHQAAETGNAQELIDLFSMKLLSSIERKSRLKELFGVLDTSPFWLTVVHENDNDDDPMQGLMNSATEFAASLQGRKLPQKFTSKPPTLGSSDLSWSWPSTCIGVLVKPFRKKVFIVPQELATAHRDLLAEDDDAPENARPTRKKFMKWLAAHGGKASPGWRDDQWELPDLEYNESTGYGWLEAEFEDLRHVYLSIRPNDGGLGAWLTVAYSYDEPLCIPRPHGMDLAAKVARNGAGKPDFSPWLIWEDYSFQAIEWPEWEEEISGRPSAFLYGLPQSVRLRPAEAFAFCQESDHNDWFWEEDFGAWLHDEDHPELKSLLLGLDPEVRFIPMDVSTAE